MIAGGTRARVTVPATSANLGPGFDALGLALTIRDSYEVTTTDDEGIVVRVTGESALDLPADETHLVARALTTGLARFGRSAAGFRLVCDNAIPQSRGLGSSAAAIVGGVALAAALADVTDPMAVVELATEIEGHPDNVAAAALGGLTVSWVQDGTGRAVALPVADTITPVLFIPSSISPTAAARAALPESVPHADAAFNAGRSALLVAALTTDPQWLFPATEDRLHQRQRRATYGPSLAVVDELRTSGWAAVISGAGPSVVVLAERAEVDQVAAQRFEGFRAVVSGVGAGVIATRIP